MDENADGPLAQGIASGVSEGFLKLSFRAWLGRCIGL